MMTALSQAEDKARADKLGADRYLVKSQVTLEDVAKVAREVLMGNTPAVHSLPTEPASESPEPPAATNVPATEPAAAVAPAVSAPSVALPVATIVPVSSVTPAADADAGVSDLVTASVQNAVAAEPAVTIAPDPTPPPTVPDIERTSAEVWAEPTTRTEDNEAKAKSDPTAAAEANVAAAPTQSLADEEAAIAKQIEGFIAKPAEAPPEAAPQPPVPESPVEVVPVKETTDTAVKVDAQPETPSKPSGQKIIIPLNDINKSGGPNLDDLVQKEIDKEQAEKAEQLAKTPSTVIVPQTLPADTSGIDPNSLAL